MNDVSDVFAGLFGYSVFANAVRVVAWCIDDYCRHTRAREALATADHEVVGAVGDT